MKWGKIFDPWSAPALGWDFPINPAGFPAKTCHWCLVVFHLQLLEEA